MQASSDGGGGTTVPGSEPIRDIIALIIILTAMAVIAFATVLMILR
jgi:hypothetical protein